MNFGSHDKTLFARLRHRPGAILIGTFGGLILLGAGLLSLPLAHAPGHSVTALDALFTATSAVCVTGLIVVDTGQDFSLVGQAIILVLIQLGGIGIMTFAALILQLVGKRLSFGSQMALQDVFYQRQAAIDFRRKLKWIVALTLAIEAIGVVLLYLTISNRPTIEAPGWVALFHAISAF